MKINKSKEWFRRSAEIEGNSAVGAGALPPVSPITSGQIEAMVGAFLSWPLPPSACPDACALDQNYPYRSGTNLLTAAEARQMFEHVLSHLLNERTEAPL